MTTPKTRTQIIYAALDRAIAGPKNDDPRRNGTSEERLQYLTDSVVDALDAAYPSVTVTQDGTVIINGVSYPATAVAHAVDRFVSLPYIKWSPVRQDERDSRSFSAIRADDKSVAYVTVSKPWWADTDIDKIAARIRATLEDES